MAILRPLAYQLRPRKLSEVVGQSDLIGKDKPITQMVTTRHIQSFILYGPAGTGKTSIASALANDLNLPFNVFNAAIDAKKKLQQIAKKAENEETTQVVFVDEIHRLTKTNQDFLLPYVENGSFLLIGATTENPYIALSPAIRSRSQIFQVKPSNEADVLSALNRALDRQPVIDLITNEYGKDVTINDESIEPLLKKISERTNGDVRTAFNALEYILSNATVNEQHELVFDDDELTAAMPNQNFNFDKSGDYHYDTISAFQKSIRGSDVDAALIYLARLLKSGDLEIIIRRLSVIAFEDIGVADPTTVNFAINAINIAKQVGLKEGRIPLSDAVIKLCLAPKSNVGEKSIDNAMNIVEHDNQQTVPNHLSDTHYKNAYKLGHIGYKYPHNYPNHIIKQQYLPDNLINQKVFLPDPHNGSEQDLINRWHAIKHIIR